MTLLVSSELSCCDITLKLGWNKRVNKIRIHPSKERATLAPKLFEQILLWNSSTHTISQSAQAHIL